jgi:acetyl esterase/lipase
VLIYGENDFMRRPIEAFKAKLAKAGVDCQWEIVKGNGHNFLFFFKNKKSVLSE